MQRMLHQSASVYAIAETANDALEQWICINPGDHMVNVSGKVFGTSI
jgi:hypothetical protein